MKFDSFGGGDNGESNRAGLMEIFEIFAAQGDFFYDVMPFDGV